MKYTAIFFALILAFPVMTFSQDSDTENAYSWNQKHKARQVVLNHLSLGNDRFAPACRDNIAPMGCRNRVNALVNAIFSSAQRHKVDPWVMVALAYETTHFHPFHTNEHGFTGIMGISPHVTFRLSSPFYRNPTYRQNCLNQADACQIELIDHSIEQVADSMEYHDESLARTLTRFSSENEASERARFSRHVRRRARAFRNAAEEVEELDACSVHRMACEH